MSKRQTFGVMIVLVLYLFGPVAARQAQAAEFQGTQPGGALYRIVVPNAGWNGRLVAFAHGYVFPVPGAPLGFFDTLPDGTNVGEVVTGLGYAYAVTSYRQNGLAVQEGTEDLLELVQVVFPSVVGESPSAVYLVGASHGGLVAALSLERHPWAYAGGLAACGPIGSFRGQVDYFGDARVLFDYFFPLILPGSPVAIPLDLFANWQTVYAPLVAAAVAAQPDRAAEAARVAGLAYDRHDPGSLAEAWVGVLSYTVFATNDATAKLGGSPYDNTRRLYLGSRNDFLLNRRVQRFQAHPGARAGLEAYETTGILAPPIVTIHTTHDPIVPYWHELLYRGKTLRSGSWVPHLNVPIPRAGHCAFRRQELLFAFALLQIQIEGF